MATAVTVFRMDPKSLALLPLGGLGGADQATPASAVPTAIWTAYQKSVG